MKKLNRKLIPAFAMLLLSAVLMSTASFAWFSSNGQVSASGLSVSATAPAALWISNNGKDFGTSVTFNVGNAKTGISPVTDDIASATNIASKTGEWAFHALTAEGRAAIGNDGLINKAFVTAEKMTIGDKEVTVAAPDTTNFIKQTFQLRLEGANDGTEEGTESAEVKVKVTLNTEATKIDTIWKAIRVALIAEGGTDSVGGYQVFTPAKDATLASGTGCVMETKTEGTDVLLTLVAQEQVNVHVYVWFEGNDEDCKNNDSIYGIDYSIALDFFCPSVQNPA